MGDIQKYEGFIEQLEGDANLASADKESLKKGILDKLLDKLLTDETYKEKKYEELNREIKFYKGTSTKEFILYARDLELMRDSKQYKEHYKRFGDYTKEELGIAESTAKEQIYVYQFFLKNRREMDENSSAKFEYSKLKEAVTILRREDIDEKDREELSNKLYEDSLKKNSADMKSEIGRLKTELNRPEVDKKEVIKTFIEEGGLPEAEEKPEEVEKAAEPEKEGKPGALVKFARRMRISLSAKPKKEEYPMPSEAEKTEIKAVLEELEELLVFYKKYVD